MRNKVMAQLRRIMVVNKMHAQYATVTMHVFGKLKEAGFTCIKLVDDGFGNDTLYYTCNFGKQQMGGTLVFKSPFCRMAGDIRFKGQLVVWYDWSYREGLVFKNKVLDYILEPMQCLTKNKKV